ncbi:MAG TPA: serine/threonine-protein kinase [Roseateles sp.]
MDEQGKQRWLALSPLLDELLDLDEPAREQRLQALDADTARQLRELLARDAELQAQGFMGQGAAEALNLGAAPVQQQLPDLSGQLLGPYRLERELGQGGMGAVWLASRADGRFDGQVAVKFLKAGVFGSGDAGRFAREGRILARLSHPHIARLLDAGVYQELQPYLVLEYVDGQPIDAYCRERGLDLRARVALFLDVLAAVAHAHARLILHRDLKPSNILVTPAGEVKLLDFGIAKLLDDATDGGASDATELTRRAGNAYTPQYAAPEQVQQADVTTATDVYALGVLLFQLLGGGHPTADDTHTQLDRLKAIVELVPRRLSDAAASQPDEPMARHARELRGDLDTIVAKALKKAPAERYANAQALADDLRRWQAHEPIAARPDSRWYVAGRFVRRHRMAVAAGSLAVLALLGLTATSLLQTRRAEAAERQAQARRQQAEELLTYLLGEMASQLRPVGRLSLLEGIGQQALRVLGGQEATDVLSTEDLIKRVKALLMLAEVNLQKDHVDVAAQALASAERWLQQAQRQSSDEEAVLRQGTQLAFWLGELALQQGRHEEAVRHWTKHEEIALHWRRKMPSGDEPLLEISYARGNLGTLSLYAMALQEATRRFNEALASSRQLYAGHPESEEYQTKLGDDLVWALEAEVASGHARDALSLSDELLALLARKTAAQPKDLVPKVDQAIALGWRAQALEALGRAPEAALAGQQALALLREASAGDGSNQRWRRLLLERQALELLSQMQSSSTSGPALRSSADALRRALAPAGTSTAITRNVLVLWEARQAVPAQAVQFLNEALALPADWVPTGQRPRFSELRTRAALEFERQRLARMHDLPLPPDTCRAALAYWAPVARAGIAGPVPELWRQLADCR